MFLYFKTIFLLGAGTLFLAHYQSHSPRAVSVARDTQLVSILIGRTIFPFVLYLPAVAVVKHG